MFSIDLAAWGHYFDQKSQAETRAYTTCLAKKKKKKKNLNPLELKAKLYPNSVKFIFVQFS